MGNRGADAVGLGFCLLAVALVAAFVSTARWGCTAGVMQTLEVYCVSISINRTPTALQICELKYYC